MKIKILYITVSLMLSIILSGCSDDWLDEKIPHIMSTETIYGNIDGFEIGLNGLYGLVREEYENKNRVQYLQAAMFTAGNDNSTTNMVGPSGYCLPVVMFWADQNNSMVEDYADTWIWLYSIINSANTIIGRAETRTDIDWGDEEPENRKNLVIANAKTLRAYAYRHLTYGWGDVPLSLIESGEIIKTDWERTPVEEVRRQIMSDLLFAEKHIAVRPALEGRITKGAVQHYLAEMYLVLNKPDSALFWANKVINTPEYKLITQRFGVNKDKPGVIFSDMFADGNTNYGQGNTEVLWVYQFALQTIGGGACEWTNYFGSRYSEFVRDGIAPIQLTNERGARGRSRQSATKWFLDSYEPEDDRGSNYCLRKFFILKDAATNAPYPADRLPPGYSYGDTLWLNWEEDINPNNTKVHDWPWPRKREAGANPADPSGRSTFSNQIRLRLAETYLLKAEAELLTGNSEAAASSINVIRRRSNASEITAADVDIDFILDERSRELMMEEDRRWQLLRTGKWLERLRKYNHNGGQFATERDQIPSLTVKWDWGF
jgi:hypothetical protein